MKTEKSPHPTHTQTHTHTQEERKTENEVIVDFSLQFKIVFECLRTVVVVETEFGVRVSVFEFSSLLRGRRFFTTQNLDNSCRNPF